MYDTFALRSRVHRAFPSDFCPEKGGAAVRPPCLGNLLPNPPLSVQREDRRIQVQADAACLVTLQLADSRLTTGCQVIIADGLRGTDEVEVPVPNGEYCKTAKIGRAIMDADIFISLSHFKGHESTGFGGAIKNIGMGCGSRAGKMEQHASGHPAVQEDLCRGCHRCAKECGSDAIYHNEKNKAVIDQDKCKGCGRCIGACNFDAIYALCDSANEMLDRKMAEYAAAVCHDRPTFHISLVQDISPNCDCHGENDAPILPDIGMFASFDPVALDQACADACLNAAPLPNSQLGQNLATPGWNCHHDNFKDSNPNIEWKATLEQAEKIGMGTRAYTLKKV